MTARWVVLVMAAACARASTDSPGDTHQDAPTGPATDATATVDASSDGSMPIDAGLLDPDLLLPDPNGQVCSHPGAIGSPECPAVDQVCRYFTPTEGRCESCTACGNLNAPCAATNECDILFECYLGRCTNFCTLGTSECGAPADCINIGNATRGVCRPM